MAGSFHSHIDRKGGVSRWVAGITTTHDIVFLANLNEVILSPNGRTTTYKLYALTRYVPFEANPLGEYELKKRSTRVRSAKLMGGQDRRDRLNTVEQVPVSLLLENGDVQMALGRLYHRIDRDTLDMISTVGWGSLFEAAYLCASEVIQPGGQTGRVELEAKIYYLESLDFRLHSVFRIE